MTKLSVPFIKSIPYDCAYKVNALSGSAVKVFVLIWYLSGVQKTQDSVIVTQKKVNKFHIPKISFHRGLSDLETHKVISITREKGKSPRVSLLCRPDTKGLFIKALPVACTCRVNTRAGSAAKVFLLLWYLSGLQNTQKDISITYKNATDFHIPQKSLQHGLSDLEKAGVISMTKGRGKAISVTILYQEGAWE